MLLVFLPPLLYAAAIVTPVRELRENLQPISLLAFSLVLAPGHRHPGPGLPGPWRCHGAVVSLALGADLGGNATAIGASANLVILGLAQRAGQPIRFLEFTSYGAVVAVATMLVCVPYLWLRYFVLA